MPMNSSPASAEPTTTLPTLVPSPPRVRDLERLGDEIAELSAHLDAATARLLGLIREFDAHVLPGGSGGHADPEPPGSTCASRAL